ncbi:MAG: M28 family peptidase [Treponema sp.]|nr:M28 family peptidase [Treponema sp.]
MSDQKLKGSSWKRFEEFISLEADRFKILQELIEEASLEYKVLEISGSRHFIISPVQPKAPKGQSSPSQENYLRRPPVILVAHYDRAEGSPGANDNSAAVFILLETAVKLKKDAVFNWLVIFTDKEELKPGESIQAQGAYVLAKGFELLKTGKNRIFCFDACGTGDTLIISTTLEHLLGKDGAGEKLRQPMMELRKLALKAARNLGMKKVQLAPTPFSDDLGFFRAGLCAQTITMLPSAEYNRLVYEMQKDAELAGALIKAKSRKKDEGHFMPETWRKLNSPEDCFQNLTPRNFQTLMHFAEALCRG